VPLDLDFARTLLAGYHADGGRFGHRQHLHAALSFLRRYGPEDGAAAMLGFIRHVAEHEGAPEKVNETVTEFWVRAVRCADAPGGEPAGFEELLAGHPQLLDKDLPLRHWTRERLGSAQARQGWVEPDLAPLPF